MHHAQGMERLSEEDGVDVEIDVEAVSKGFSPLSSGESGEEGLVMEVGVRLAVGGKGSRF